MDWPNFWVGADAVGLPTVVGILVGALPRKEAENHAPGCLAAPIEET